ncbi:uncharacterized protein CLUP02_18292 [Colletotrichum lupini]|uniref:Uncharacterized protein n=1 Tax=Colletotrichum lupini TaxID=145971 RepID=A0A9Q8WBL7_9PEZI|nr:uncharacterized protein CLUP02_18292 [Colletotrichum lupini]UQC76777.1 hypothetical protein CLUP02_18292 [Colletotrichum lupini]
MRQVEVCQKLNGPVIPSTMVGYDRWGSGDLVELSLARARHSTSLENKPGAQLSTTDVQVPTDRSSSLGGDIQDQLPFRISNPIATSWTTPDDPKGGDGSTDGRCGWSAPREDNKRSSDARDETGVDYAFGAATMDGCGGWAHAPGSTPISRIALSLEVHGKMTLFIKVHVLVSTRLRDFLSRSGLQSIAAHIISASVVLMQMDFIRRLHFPGRRSITLPNATIHCKVGLDGPIPTTNANLSPPGSGIFSLNTLPSSAASPAFHPAENPTAPQRLPPRWAWTDSVTFSLLPREMLRMFIGTLGHICMFSMGLTMHVDQKRQKKSPGQHRITFPKWGRFSPIRTKFQHRCLLFNMYSAAFRYLPSADKVGFETYLGFLMPQISAPIFSIKLVAVDAQTPYGTWLVRVQDLSASGCLRLPGSFAFTEFTTFCCTGLLVKDGRLTASHRRRSARRQGKTPLAGRHPWTITVVGQEAENDQSEICSAPSSTSAYHGIIHDIFGDPVCQEYGWRRSTSQKTQPAVDRFASGVYTVGLYAVQKKPRTERFNSPVARRSRRAKSLVRAMSAMRACYAPTPHLPPVPLWAGADAKTRLEVEEVLPESPDQPAEHAFLVLRRGREGLLSVPAKIVKAFVEQGDKRRIRRGACAVRSDPCPVCSQLELWVIGDSYRARKPPSVYNTHAVVEFLYGYMRSIHIVNTLTEGPTRGCGPKRSLDPSSLEGSMNSFIGASSLTIPWEFWVLVRSWSSEVPNRDWLSFPKESLYCSLGYKFDMLVFNIRMALSHQHYGHIPKKSFHKVIIVVDDCVFLHNGTFRSPHGAMRRRREYAPSGVLGPSFLSYSATIIPSHKYTCRHRLKSVRVDSGTRSWRLVMQLGMEDNVWLFKGPPPESWSDNARLRRVKFDLRVYHMLISSRLAIARKLRLIPRHQRIQTRPGLTSVITWLFITSDYLEKNQALQEIFALRLGGNSISENGQGNQVTSRFAAEEKMCPHGYNVKNPTQNSVYLQPEDFTLKWQGFQPSMGKQYESGISLFTPAPAFCDTPDMDTSNEPTPYSLLIFRNASNCTPVPFLHTRITEVSDTKDRKLDSFKTEPQSQQRRTSNESASSKQYHEYNVDSGVDKISSFLYAAGFIGA